MARKRVQRNKIIKYLASKLHTNSDLSAPEKMESITEVFDEIKTVRLSIKIKKMSKDEIIEIQNELAHKSDKKYVDLANSATPLVTEGSLLSQNNTECIKNEEKNVAQQNFVNSNSRITRSKARDNGIDMNIVVNSNSLQSRVHKRKLLNDDTKNAPKRKKLDNLGSIKQCSKPIHQQMISESNSQIVLQDENLIEGNSVEQCSNIDQPMASEINTQCVTPIAEQFPTTVAEVDFKIDEIVWAKIKGFPHWPAQIKSFPSCRMAEVFWYNDYRKTKLYKTQLFKFLKHFDQFAKKFDDVIGLKVAAQEALICFGQNINQNIMFQ